ncbi:MAG: SpoIID/LytB domain-containing protein [Synechococcaceae cyanobacterium]|nr:SpoIID/LytB domain-containing protein [Synechococcaceae cyanobacterium]
MPRPSLRSAAARRLRRPLPLLLLPCSLLLAGALPLPGTAPMAEAQQQPALQDVVLRVLLQQGEALTIAAGKGPLEVQDNDGTTLLTLAPGQKLQLDAAGGALIALRAEAVDGAERVLRQRDLWIAPPPGTTAAHLQLRGRAYRGRLQVRAERGQLQAINHIPLETYLTSVVGSEMPASWPQAALQAQAVAARTYALAKRRPSAPFDVRATVASQVYRGVEGETPSTRDAVSSTRGQVLLYGDALIEAVFHSSSGGSTENSGDLWNRQLPYLISVPDFDASSPVSQWRERFAPSQLERSFQETGGVRRIDILSVSRSGRIRRVKVVGPRGSLLLSGAELRQRLGLRSTLVQLELIAGQALPAETAANGAQGSGDPGPGAAAGTGSTASGTGASAALMPTPSPRPAPLNLGGDALWGQAPPALPALPALPSSATMDPAAAPTLLVIGKGFGHGVGMSQWGAYGMALQGKDYQQILRHYYRGVELKPWSASSL